MTAVHFTVLCIGSMSQGTASAALASVPSDLFSFSFGTPTEGTNWAHAYPSVFSNEPGQGDLPVPLTDYTLCLSNPGDWSSPGLNLGTTIVGSHKCGVYNYDSYFSAVILHELLHTLPVPNGDTLRTNQQFNQWVITNRPAHPYLADPANYADHSEFMVLGNEYLVYVARGGAAPSSPPPTVKVGDPVIITRPRYPQSPDDTEAVLVPQPSNTTVKVFVSYTSPVSLSGTANPIDDLLNDYVDWLLGEMVRLFQFFDGSAEFWKWLQGMGFGWMWPWFMMFAQFGDVNRYLSIANINWHDLCVVWDEGVAVTFFDGVGNTGPADLVLLSGAGRKFEFAYSCPDGVGSIVLEDRFPVDTYPGWLYIYGGFPIWRPTPLTTGCRCAIYYKGVLLTRGEPDMGLVDRNFQI